MGFIDESLIKYMNSLKIFFLTSWLVFLLILGADIAISFFSSVSFTIFYLLCRRFASS